MERNAVMEKKVRAFNRLPRKALMPGGMANHWMFGVLYVPHQPAGDIVTAFNPSSEYIISGGPGQILSQISAADRARAMLPYLLDAFVDGHKPPTPEMPSPAPFAPYTWSALDQETAGALQQALKEHGVRRELCQVGVGTAEERVTLDAARGVFWMV